jgi:hypothetical protein
MPGYFFNVHDGRSSPDQEGTELPDIGTARAQAVGFSGEVLRDTGAKYWDHPDWRLDVLGEGGEPCSRSASRLRGGLTLREGMLWQVLR